MNSKLLIKLLFLFSMEARYKNETFHMLQSFNNTKQTFKSKNHEKGQKVNEVRGQIGSTWDARHLTKFLSKSNYSNQEWCKTYRSDRPSVHKRAISTHDHFFKTTTDNKNASKIGYTGINPLVTTSSAEKFREQAIKSYLNQPLSAREGQTVFKQGNFKFTANSVKFNKTDPLTSQHLSTHSPTNFEKQRMKRLIEKRHPHGMTGVDHPENENPTFYNKYIHGNTRIRVQPNSRRTHIIDRDWKSKGRSPQFPKEQGWKKSDLLQLRKFSNDNVHGYNILNNREL